MIYKTIFLSLFIALLPKISNWKTFQHFAVDSKGLFNPFRIGDSFWIAVGKRIENEVDGRCGPIRSPPDRPNSNVDFDFANGDIAIKYVLDMPGLSHLPTYRPVRSTRILFSPHFISIFIDSFCNYRLTTTDALSNPLKYFSKYGSKYVTGLLSIAFLWMNKLEAWMYFIATLE